MVGIDPLPKTAPEPVGGLPMGGPPLTPPSVSPLLCTPPREQPKPGAQLRTIIFPGNFPPLRDSTSKKFSPSRELPPLRDSTSKKFSPPGNCPCSSPVSGSLHQKNFPPLRELPIKKFSPSQDPTPVLTPSRSHSSPETTHQKNFPLPCSPIQDPPVKKIFLGVFPTCPVLSQVLSERRVFLGRGALLPKVGFAKKFSMVENASRKVGIVKKFSMVFLYL